MTNLALRMNQRAPARLRLGRLSPMTIAVITTVVLVIVPSLSQLTAPLVTPDEGLLIGTVDLTVFPARRAER